MVQNELNLGARRALRRQRRAAPLLVLHPGHGGVRGRGRPRLSARRCPAERRRGLLRAPPAAGQGAFGDERAPGKCSFSGDKAAEARGVRAPPRLRSAAVTCEARLHASRGKPCEPRP